MAAAEKYPEAPVPQERTAGNYGSSSPEKKEGAVTGWLTLVALIGLAILISMAKSWM